MDTEAVKGRGIEDLYQAIQKHRQYLHASDSGRLENVLRKRARNQLVETLRDESLSVLLDRIASRGDSLDDMVGRIVSKETDPYSLVQEVLSRELK